MRHLEKALYAASFAAQRDAKNVPRFEVTAIDSNCLISSSCKNFLDNQQDDH